MNDLLELQKSEFEILIKFKEVCEKYELSYFLTAGSLLGSIRHEGFIPWDDDIDIAMPRKDYNKLIKLPKEVFGDMLFLQNSKTDENFPFYFSKLRKKGTYVEEEIFLDVDINKGIFIDIFPLDICPKSDNLTKIFFKSIEVISFAHLSKVSPNFKCGYTKKLMISLVFILKLLPIQALCVLRDLVRYVFSVSSSQERLCTVGGTHGYPRECYHTKWFSDAIFSKFENELFPIPSHWDDILTSMYGDYNSYPEEYLRTGHFINTKKKEN